MEEERATASSSPVKSVVEGKTRLAVPDVSRPEDGFAFYNPRMSLARDLSVAAVPSTFSFCDLLAACGARGIRLSVEKGLTDVTLIDKNPSAVRLIEQNLRDNGVENRVRIVHGDANGTLYNEGRFYDFIDIDPFGSPVPFLDSGILFSKKMIAITATDTAALCGVYPRVSKRRYMAHIPFKTPFFHEVGVRVLAGFAVRMAARHDVALRPVLSQSSDHYYRIYFERAEGAGRADEALGKVGFLHHCRDCFYSAGGSESETPSGPCPSCGGKIHVLGPLLLGNLWDASFCETALNECSERGFLRAEKLLELMIQESSLADGFFYNLHELCSKLSIGPPKSSSVIEELSKQGFRVCRTHFDPRGIRTDAGLGELNKILLSLWSSKA